MLTFFKRKCLHGNTIRITMQPSHIDFRVYLKITTLGEIYRSPTCLPGWCAELGKQGGGRGWRLGTPGLQG